MSAAESSSDPIDPRPGERVLLRRWQTEDREPFARMNRDPRVLKFLPGALSRAESDAMIARIEAGFERHGFGFWALEVPGVLPFAGFVGLSVPRFEAAFTPCVEIGWRLDPAAWGKGYATEAARLCVRHAFEVVRLEEILSFTVPANRPSLAVMERIGMRPHPLRSFEHPALSEGHPLRHHLLYRLERADPAL